MSRFLVDSGIKWIGSLPSTWSITTVNKIFYRRKEVNDVENPTVLSLARDGVKIRDISTNEGQLAESYDNYHKVYKDDLMINPMDLVSGANCSLSEVEGVISPAYINLAKKKTIYPKFYDYFFKYQYWVKAMFIHGKGVSFNNRWTLNWETMSGYKLPLPSYDEQKKIANYLNSKCEAINNIIKDNNKEIELIKEYKNTLMSKVVKIGIGNHKSFKKTNYDWIGDIPSEWDVYKLRFLGSFRSGLSNKKPEDFGFGYPFLTYKDVYNNFSFNKNISELVNSNEQDWNSANIKKGDVFFTGSSETIEELGFSSVCTEDIDKGTFNGFCIRFRPNNRVDMNPEYYKYFFRSNVIREFLTRNDNSVTRTNLSQGTLKNVLVLVPPINEQKEIANYLDNKFKQLNDVIDYRKKIIEKLEEYKRSLIYECVTGKREV